MNKIISFLTIFLTFCSITICSAQYDQNVSVNDFVTLIGSWQGTLTYLDYSSGEPFTMPADIDIGRIEKTRKFVFSNIYPNETNANSIDTIAVSDEGKFINNESVRSRRQLINGKTEIITEESGKDGNDNRSAVFRHSYIIGKDTFTIKKEVQFLGETEWIRRHEYSFTRKTGM